MESAGHGPAPEGRGYVPNYTVRYRGSQLAEHRFGSDRRAGIREMLRNLHDTEDPPDFSSQWEGFPHVARARMNLTALSQHYDLYFVAYRGYIHVYRLNRGVKVALGEPEVILDPKNHESAMAKHVHGYINPRCPHEINHMIIGDLGDEEIFLVGRDNGDVVAWYTQTIAHYVQSNMSRSAERSQCNDERLSDISPTPDPKHFFADNVGISAWGLAIHKKSRLIAVSSNAHEITVFAFAMNRKGEAANPPSSSGPEDDNHKPMPTGGEKNVDTTPYDIDKVGGQELRGAFSTLLMEDETGPLPPCPFKPATEGAVDSPELTKATLPWKLGQLWITESEAKARVAELQREFQTQGRQHTWRIVLSLGKDASNVPSIAFCEDAEGNADRVAGIDINGYLYLVGIWQLGRKPIRIPPHIVQTPLGRRQAAVRGWNLLPVTDAHLLPTDTVDAAIGLDPNKAVLRATTRRGKWLDISKCMAEVAYDAASNHHQRRIARYIRNDISSERDGMPPDFMPNSDGDEDEDEDEEPMTPALMAPQLTTPSPPPSKWDYPPPLDPLDGVDFGGGPVSLAMTMVPYLKVQHAAFSTPEALVEYTTGQASVTRARKVRAALTLPQFRKKARAWKAEDLLRDVSFLRFNEHDVEMLSLGETDCGAVCHHVLENWNEHDQAGYWDMRFSKRCSMLLRIPELNLVVMGSMCGRVALITLTKPPQLEEALTPVRNDVPRRAFRVDAVLPFESEEKSRERPYVCLLGIAVSPVPEARAQGLELRRLRRGREDGRAVEGDPPRRWRLILNYQDHTVLQYEILARDEGEKGSWKGFTGPTAYEGRKFKVMGSDEDDAETSDEEESQADGSEDVDSSELGTDISEADHPGWEDEEMTAATGAGQWVETDSDDDDFPDMQIA